MRQLLLALCLAPVVSPVGLAFDDWDGLHSAVLAIGDVNGDGAGDFVVAHRPRPFGMGNAPSETMPIVEQLPRLWALSGRDGAVLWSVEGHARFGTRLARVGDLDGDGVVDLATAEDVPSSARVSAPEAEVSTEVPGPGRRPVPLESLPHPDAGKARVVILSGATGAELGALVPPRAPHRFGTGIAGGLQVVGDRTPDLVVGSHGRVWLVDGATLEPVRSYRLARDGSVHEGAVDGWSTLPAIDGVTWMPADKREHGDFGNNLALLPDVDKDGLAELVVGGLRPKSLTAEAGLLRSPDRDPGERSSWVLFSGGVWPAMAMDSAAWCAVALDDLDADGVPELATTTVDQHLRVWSLGQRKLLWEQRFDGGYMHAEGTSLAAVTDRDGDGRVDLMLGTNETAIDCDIGSVQVFSTADGKALDGRQSGPSDATPEDLEPSMSGGMDADSIGDLDRDGKDDFAVMLPVYQEVRVLAGPELEVLWARTFRELLNEVQPAPGGEPAAEAAQPGPDPAD
ncbi:MAG: hypothetical protein P1V81_07640 [Planctomycetota bacterium]|nr:hypothetical protein [Planctomycetota bacterium]